MKVCKECGAKMEDSALFCSECASKEFELQSGKCQKCGAELPEGSVYCFKCGEPLLKEKRGFKSKKKLIWIGISGVVLVALLLIAWNVFMPSLEKQLQSDTWFSDLTVSINKLALRSYSNSDKTPAESDFFKIDFHSNGEASVAYSWSQKDVTGTPTETDFLDGKAEYSYNTITKKWQLIDDNTLQYGDGYYQFSETEMPDTWYLKNGILRIGNEYYTHNKINVKYRDMN